MAATRKVRCVLAVLLAAYSLQGEARQLGSRAADAWIATLENPGRIAGMKIDEVVARLRLHPGSTVADIGAGAAM
jgi:hypothetical protein